MKLRIISLLALVLFAACGKTEAQRQKDEVDTYMAGILKGNGENQMGMKLFAPAQIPALLSYANDEREINPPANPLSSFLSVSSLGMYALWLVEGIRVAEVDSEKTKVFMGYPSLNPLAGKRPCLLWCRGLSGLPEKGGRGLPRLVEFRRVRQHQGQEPAGRKRPVLVTPLHPNPFSGGNNEIPKSFPDSGRRWTIGNDCISLTL